MKTTRLKLLALGVAILTALAATTILSLEFLGNKTKPANPIRVACIGDSITEDFGYPDELWMMLGADFNVSNFGAGGTTVSLSSDKPYMNQTAFQKAKDFQPAIVVIMLGTNDATQANHEHIDDFIDDYKALIAAFQALESKPKIWLVKPPPIFNNTLGPDETYLTESVIPRIEQVAKDLDLPIVDVHAALANLPEYFIDGVHPNSEGARRIAAEVYDAVKLASTSA